MDKENQDQYKIEFCGDDYHKCVMNSDGIVILTEWD